MSVEISPVASRRDRREFVELPYRLHSTSEQWIPPLRLERRLFLTPRFNPFFKEGEVGLFLARRDGRVVGRISAQVDRAFNDHHGTSWGWFGFLEMEDDPEIAEALFGAAEGWLRERGQERMIGPSDFRMNDETGVLIEGYDREPMIRQNWHPPYYKALCEACELDKVVDLYMWELHISDREKIVPAIFELAAQVGPKHGIELRKMSRRHLRRDLDVFGEIYNDAWKRNFGFVPYSKEDLDEYAQSMQLVFDRDWFMIAEHKGEPVAIAITIPDVNQVLKRMRGRLLPLGWWRYLRRKRVIDRCRVGFLGVKPEYQHTGVAAALYVEHFDNAGRLPVKWGEMGWILENNRAMNRGMEAMNGRIVKRYRMYERRFDPAAEPARPKNVEPA